jgi:succinate-acetate transporter protein
MSATVMTPRQRIGTDGADGESAAAAPTAATTAIASGGPLGLCGFALTTFLLSMVNANLVNKGVEPIVFGTAFAFGGLAQLLAGMWEFRAGNTFAATAFSAYGAFWLSFWALIQFYIKDIPAAQVGNAVGLYLIAWGLFTGLMFIASFKTNRAVNAVFGLLFVTFLLLGIGNAGGHTDIVHAGGFVGLLTAATAAYTALAEVTNSTFGRTVLPLGML